MKQMFTRPSERWFSPTLLLASFAMAACTTAPAPIAPPPASPSTVALVAAMATTATPATLPSHADVRAAYLAFDGTRNAALDSTEWRHASAALFDATDRNHDGLVDRRELGPNVMVREGFSSFDEGRDGKLTKDEFLALRETIFRAADLDRNDYITFVEYELLVLLRRTGWKDRDRDGRIAMSELSTVLARAFPLLDADHNGALVGNELALFAPAHIAAMDPRRTGRITLDQLINGYRFLLGADQINRNLVPRAVPLSR